MLRVHHPQLHPASRVTWQHRTLARRDSSRDTDTCRPHRIPTVEPEIKRHQQETKESQTKAKPILWRRQVHYCLQAIAHYRQKMGLAQYHYYIMDSSKGQDVLLELPLLTRVYQVRKLD